MFRKPVLAFAGVTALSALAFAPLVNPGTTDSADGKARAVAASTFDIDDDAVSRAIAASERLELVPCVVELAGPFACNNVDLVDVVPTAGFGAVHGSDSWGWTDDDGTEYVIVTSGVGVGFFRLAEDGTADYLGTLERSDTADGILWNDVKVVNDHAYISSEDAAYGLQIVDMKAVAELESIPLGTGRGVIDQVGFVESSGAHNVVGFEERGIVAMTLAEDDVCGNDIVFYDVSDTPKEPRRLGCVGGSQDNWLGGGTHDAQCVTYAGPDADYNGAGEDGVLGTEDDVPASDICLFFQEDAGVYVVDVSAVTRDGNAAGAEMLTRFTYDSINYTHQGWFTDNQRWVLFNDELDESGAAATALGGRGSQNLNTTTYWVDLEDLDVGATQAASPFPDVNQELVRSWSNENTIAIDHNMYPVGIDPETGRGLLFQANYGAGLRVLQFSDESLAGDPAEAFEEVAYFDTYPGPGPSEFYGAWNTYPFFESGKIVLSDFQSGLLVLDVHDEVYAD